MPSVCCVCKKEFKEGDSLQAKFAMEGEPLEWNLLIIVDAEYQERAAQNGDNFQRKHTTCIDTSAPNRPPQSTH